MTGEYNILRLYSSINGNRKVLRGVELASQEQPERNGLLFVSEEFKLPNSHLADDTKVLARQILLRTILMSNLVQAHCS
jgi:hypothetical protein